MSGFEPLRLDVSYLHHKELNLVANTRYRNSRNRTLLPIHAIGTVGIEPTHIIRPSTIQLSRRYLYRFPITVHVPTV
ncbi:hypothetical protein [Streptococcus agalactiae]|uniref:hypothetical protein n=1 Tax=Streptococcus agalactiae TaxID=1311 RepID=UPI00178D03D9|nr:hypothetical protein [Streptococcus agalactiae]